MNTIIDGHNLISKIPGLDLGMLDDEERLIELLNQYGEKTGKIEVYFDGAPPGHAGMRTYGRIKAHFVPQNQTADLAIQTRLSKLGKSARNWVVVTSDRSVQSAAREAHAMVMKSEDFTRQLLTNLRNGVSETERTSDKPLSPAEVDEWLDIFKQRKGPK